MSHRSISVLHVVKWYPHDEDPQNGVFIRAQIEACSPHARQAVLYWGESSSPHTEIDLENNIPVHRLFTDSAQRFSKLTSKRRSLKEIARRYFEGKPDVIHMHIGTADQWIVQQYAKAKGIPTVLTEHWSGFLDGRFDSLQAVPKTAITQLVKRVDIMSTVSPFLADALIEKTGRTAIDIVPNVVDTPSRSEAPKKYTFGVLADLDDKIKNVSGILRAFAEVHAKDQSVTLIVIGGGKDMDRLQLLAREKEVHEAVTFAGRLPHSSAMDLLGQCSTVVINSRKETFSVVALEALALGAKLICTRCGGPETTLTDEVVEWIPINDDIALAKAMEMSLKSAPVDAEHIQSLLTPYSAEAVGNQWKDLYRGVIKSDR